MLLGCIGDDFTGSGDLANTLARQGMQTALYVGTPNTPAAAEVEAGVVAIKSRSMPRDEAVQRSLEALKWLQSQGCRQFMYKYCSTFDSTDEGNIGPVAEALAAALEADQVIVCPAFPATGRTLVHGHLFVHDQLLSESGMENHPLTPMTDPDIRRVLSRQIHGEVGYASLGTVREGPAALAGKLASEAAAGRHLIVVDALTEDDLMAIGLAAGDKRLITGGSGMAMGLPANFRDARQVDDSAAAWTGQPGPAVAVCGSCSVMTQKQVALHKRDNPWFEISVEQIKDGGLTPRQVAAWCAEQSGLPLVYSSADPTEVKRIQEHFGREASAACLESFFSELAPMLVEQGVTRLISAGGETSGAVTEGLGLAELQIGPEIDPGVPAMRAGDSLVIALKSGNFGAEDFFSKAAGILGKTA